jgi:M3 family oligoendopeptidase
LLGELGAGRPAPEVVEAWDRERRGYETWASLAYTRYSLDTRDAEAKAEKELSDELKPKIEGLEARLKARLLQPAVAAGIDAAYGPQLAALWRCDLASFDEALTEDLVAEAKLDNAYTELLASAELPFRGETLSLSTIGRYTNDPDREIRREAAAAQWGWFDGAGAELDRIFDELVKLRHGMAQKLGYESFTELGYLRMHRVDYDQADVARFRASVLADVVPLVSRLRAQQRETLGVDALKAWDMGTYSAEGNPRPRGGHDWMLERATEMFAELGPRFAEFFETMKRDGLLHLESRDGKAGGGYCTFFHEHDRPFIFANFNGSQHDVEVFTHECGHAFQVWSSRAARPSEYLWPTYESAEIHSMSLEFLCGPFMDKFFAEDADRFRWTHLAGALAFLPYGVSVDAFQHEVYANPEASPAERHAMWQELEGRLQPELDWGELSHPKKGGRWQLQRHIYGAPFYYIDYTLAQTCALQFWLAARQDRAEALGRYHELCGLGGRAPFQQLVAAAGLRSPFAAGCLTEVVAEAGAVLFGG